MYLTQPTQEETPVRYLIDVETDPQCLIDEMLALQQAHGENITVRQFTEHSTSPEALIALATVAGVDPTIITETQELLAGCADNSEAIAFLQSDDYAFGSCILCYLNAA